LLFLSLYRVKELGIAKMLIYQGIKSFL